MNLKMHIHRKVSNCCGAVEQPSDAISMKTCAARRQATRVEEHTDPHVSSRVGKQQQVLSTRDKFQRAVQPPSCQDCGLSQQRNHDHG